MWQQEQQNSGIVRLALLLALSTSPIATNLLMSASVLAQSGTETPTFSVPPTLASGTTVRVDGYSGAAIFNQNLQQSFQQQFAGTQVEISANGTEAALKAVLDGQTDIAAIGRGLTPEEKAQGLEQVRLHREKIAIIVGAENPFQGSLTDKQFARIFRGRITNWSQVGGASAKIRVIDRPNNSGTRESLSSYPVFRATKFATGATATQVTEDDTAAITKQLGKDGISYARANQVSKLPGVRVLKLHDTLPEDAKYPFSQPLVYVYKKNPNPGVAAFLGFALAPQGQQAIETARIAEAEAIAKGESSTLMASSTATNPEATTVPTTAANSETATPDVNVTTPSTSISPFLDSQNTTTSSNVTQPNLVAPPETPQNDSRALLWWLLLPIAAIGGSLFWFLRRPTSTEEVLAVTDSEPIKEPVAVGTQSQLETTQQSADVPKSFHQSPLPLPPELEQSPWDMEAPATIVNTSYPQIVDTNKSAETVIQSTSELVDSAAVESSQPHPVAEVTTLPDTETKIWSEAKEPEPQAAVELPTPVVAETSVDFPEVANHEQIDWNSDVSSELPLSDTSEEESILAELEPDVGGDLPDVSSDEQISWTDESDTNNLDALFVEPVTNSDLLDESIATDSTDVNNAIDTTDDDLAWTSDVSAELPPLDTNNLDGLFGEPVTSTEAVNTPVSSEIEENLPNTLPQFASIPEDALNSVADAAEFTELERLEDTPDNTANNVAGLVGGAVAVGAGIAWAANSETPVDNVAPTEPVSTTIPPDDEDSSIVLRPRSSDWAYVSWYIGHSDRQQMQNQGISQLSLRLYDVNEVDLSYQEPALVQHYECNPGATDNYVYIPVSDRNYVAEIGYLTAGEQWVKIARSHAVRVFSSPHTEDVVTDVSITDVDVDSQVVFTPRTPKWAYISWEISPIRQQMLRNAGISQVALRLYDVTSIDLSYQTPQLVQQYECEEIIRSRYIAIPQSDRDYMVELGYLADGERWTVIARSENVHIFSPPHGDFWFVADAELIIHGATEPGATVNIAGQAIALKPDGTFHLRVPFSEDVIEYLITVSAANGKQVTSLHKQFSQTNLDK